MPYAVKKVGPKGYQVTSPNHPEGHSKKKMSLRMARMQLAAIMKNTGGK